MNTHPLPNGSRTEDARTYLDSWHQIGDFLAKKLDVELLSYDPGFLFSYKGNSFSIPTDVVIKIYEAFND